MSLEFLASAPRGFIDLVARELEGFGATQVRERGGLVSFQGEIDTAYSACLNSRVASRIYLELGRFEAPTTESLYDAARSIDWARHLGPGATLACDWSGHHPTISNSQFGALKLKDAICDRLRAERGFRPDIEPLRPGVRVHGHAQGARIAISIDLAGEGLHRRGYRRDGGEAPLRENLAAGILLRAAWPDLAAQSAEFFDPLCGSGTLAIEAALIALDRAPGLARDYFGFLGWEGHDPAVWARIRELAQERAHAGAANHCMIRGADRDLQVLDIARANAGLAGVGHRTQFAVAELAAARPATRNPGLLATNPPYGIRLEDLEAARQLHQELGRVLREHFAGWRAVVLTGSPDLGLELGLRAHRVHTVWNGPLECRLLRIEVSAAAVRDLRPRAASGTRIDPRLGASNGSQMFGNRLRKNLQRLRAWEGREDVSCYRIYDADMPEYAFAIDRYRSASDPSEEWLYVQEYAAPRSIEEQAAERRRGEVLAALPEVTGVPVERIHLRTRRRTTRESQYRKQGAAAEFQIVAEGGLRFYVNFKDYLDTGLFLDHRLTRARLRALATGARFLNLFGYTGSATVYAAAGRARETTTVDLSRTYLEWAERNLALNGFSGAKHRWVQRDCREWLRAAVQAGEMFDLVFLDPPTFSNSKRMLGVLDVERDHGELIEDVMRLLTPGGRLIFSTNAQRFRFDERLAERYAIEDISSATLPRDFERNPRIHRAWEICARPAI